MKHNELAVTLAGPKHTLTLKNPIMTASGTFGYGAEFAKFGDLTTLGAIVVKGTSLKPRHGNPCPRIAETPCGMLNSIGLQNDGLEIFRNQKLCLLPWKDVPVIVNMYASSVEEFGMLAAELNEIEGVGGIEVNISCPNVKQGGAAFGEDPAMAASITRIVRHNAPDKPLIIKLSPNVTHIDEIARAVEEAGADIISCINTVKGMAVDLHTRRPRLNNNMGGLSGPCIKPIALYCVWQVAKAVNIPVIGVGGISSAEDVLEFMLVGASAVQIGTASFMRPDTVFKLVETLPAVMEKYGIQRLEDIRGTLKMN